MVQAIKAHQGREEAPGLGHGLGVRGLGFGLQGFSAFRDFIMRRLVS